MFRIRMATENDAEEILSIYKPYVEKTQITFEIQVPSAEEFRERIANTLKKYPYLVAEEKGEILGYAYCGEFQKREAYNHSAETTVYLREDCKGKGVGRALYEKLEEILKMQNVTNLNACIAYPHPVSIRFHERMGFKTVAHFTRCGFKLGQWWDMVWMEKIILPHETPPKPFVKITDIENEVKAMLE